jgi:hypothetical protein
MCQYGCNWLPVANELDADAERKREGRGSKRKRRTERRKILCPGGDSRKRAVDTLASAAGSLAHIQRREQLGWWTAGDEGQSEVAE